MRTDPAPGRRPTGTVSFLFTDIEGSTALWERAPSAMASALEKHDKIVGDSIAAHGGFVFATGGDGFCAAFDSAGNAVAAAIAAQQGLSAHRWLPECELRVRMGVHTGEAVERAGDYFGPAVNLSARLMGAGHGGQVLCSGTVAALTLGRTTTRPLGDHQLRGIAAAVEIHQVTGKGLADEFGPLRTVNVSRTNLPYPATSTLGRDVLLTNVIEAIGAGRLVTLSGVGGVGKTTLALEVGRQLATASPDGVWLCELAAVRDPVQVLDAIAAGLRFTPPTGVRLRDAVAEYLDGRDLVIILDNCEHIVDGVAQVTDWLLRTCASVRILATSREALATAGERVIAVAPLQVPAGDTVSDVDTSAAGALFIARAKDANAEWKINARNAPVVAHICRSLDGIPLAVELAAARSAMLDVSDIASRLGARLELLHRPTRSGQARHHTLRAALEWSYDLLNDREQRLFRRLSVFVDSFDVDAVIAIGATPDVDEWDALDSLASLVGKSLVEQDPRAAGRYRLLETIRHYASTLLADEKVTASAREVHAGHYLRIARAALEQLRTTDGVEATEQLSSDAANIETALFWYSSAARAGEAFEIFTLVPPTSFVVLPVEVTDRMARGLERLLFSQRADQQPGFSAGCAVAMWLLADDPDRSRSDRIEAARQKIGDDPYTALFDSTVCGTTGDMDRGVVVTTAGLEQLEEGSDPLLRATLLSMLAIFNYATDPTTARGHAEESLALSRTHGGAVVQVYALLAIVMCTQTDVAACAAAANKAARLDRTVRRSLSSTATIIAAHAAAAAGDLSAALPLFRESITQISRAGSRQMLAITVGTAADSLAVVAPAAALKLVAIAESGAIKAVSIVDNANYSELRRLAAGEDPVTLAARRADFAQFSYDDAVQAVIETLDSVMANEAP